MAVKRARKKRRTPAQIRATKKLIAFNKARRKKPARKRTTKRVARKNPKRSARRLKAKRWIIRALTSRKKHYYWTGKNFSNKYLQALGFPTKAAALKKAKAILKRLPAVVRSLEVKLA